MLAQLYAGHIETLRQRTDRALAAHDCAALAIFSGRAPMQFLDDQPYPFKANPHFKQWIPLSDAQESWLLYEPARRPTLLFLQPEDYWYQPGELPNDFWTTHFQIEIIRKPEEARAYIAKLRNCAFVGEPQNSFDNWAFKKVNPPGLIEQLHFTRARKTGFELECMRRASAIGAKGHRAAEQAFRNGGSEYDIHLAFLRATEQTEHDLPYSNIVALNRHGAVLHYQRQQREYPASHCSFLIDAGATYLGYACDITRTYAHGLDEFGELIERVDSLQRKLCSQVHSGSDYVDIHLAAHREAAQVLHDMSLIRTSPDAAVESGLTSVFFPHGVGHLLGLQVHDVSGFACHESGRQRAAPANHPFLRLTRTLEPGFVVTIEPGIYFIDMLLREARAGALGREINWERVETFHPYGGIRIEDDVVCTDGAPENLTRDAFARGSRGDG
jgi:Xaa-Pro dipeptidase